MASLPMIGVPQMIDLACGTPESGIINFNALHALLHVMVQNMQMQNSLIEFSGPNNAGITSTINAIPTSPTYNVTVFSAENDDGTGTYPNRVKKDHDTFDKVDTILVVRKNDAAIGYEAKSLKTPSCCISEEFAQRQPMKVPSADDFRELELINEENFEEAHSDASLLPKASLLRESLGEKKTSVSSMFNLLNLSKRMDAAEITIRKLINMVQDMGNEYKRVSETVELSLRESDLASMKDQLDNIEQKLHNGSLQGDIAVIAPPAKRRERELNKISYPKIVNPTELPNINNNELNTLKCDVDYLKMAVQRIAKCSGQKDIDIYLTMGLKNVPCPGPTAEDNRVTEDDSAALQKFEEKYEQLEARMVLTDKRVYDLEQEFAETSDRVEDILHENEVRAEQGQETAVLLEQLDGMKTQITKTSEITKDLSCAIELLKKDVQRNEEHIKLLEETKIDREEVDEMMAEKADYNMVQRKVSADHFDATKREMGLNIDEMSEKITQVDGELKSHLEALRAEMTDKMNRNEMEKIREFFLTKLQLMQDRLKAMSVSHSEPEAAGTKSKFLRDVECISCEQKVIMRRDEAQLVPKAERMVAMKSMKPQLTYELDNLRRELHQVGTSRNMHHFEKMTKGAKMCNRYCGGSHTALSAQESYQKRHFAKGRSETKTTPDVLVRGTDGTLYKAGPFEECCCNTKPSSRPEGEKTILVPESTVAEIKQESKDTDVAKSTTQIEFNVGPSTVPSAVPSSRITTVSLVAETTSPVPSVAPSTPPVQTVPLSLSPVPSNASVSNPVPVVSSVPSLIVATSSVASAVHASSPVDSTKEVPAPVPSAEIIPTKVPSKLPITEVKQEDPASPSFLKECDGDLNIVIEIS